VQHRAALTSHVRATCYELDVARAVTTNKIVLLKGCGNWRGLIRDAGSVPESLAVT
jgi:hypothetical protein